MNIYLDEFKIELEKVLEDNFPKGKCAERGPALVLFAHAVLLAKKHLISQNQSNEQCDYCREGAHGVSSYQKCKCRCHKSTLTP